VSDPVAPGDDGGERDGDGDDPRDGDGGPVPGGDPPAALPGADDDEAVRLVLVAGTTRTAAVEGISAAGADPDLRWHTPSADAELLSYGRLLRAPAFPRSPTGCPTPAAVTRAVHETVAGGLAPLVVDGGVATPTAAPTVSVGARPGRDVREADPVPTAPGAFAAARQFGRRLPVDHLVVGETIPGGTTTALATALALGEDLPVSSSLPANPLDLKREVAREALAASDLDRGEAAHHPELAVRFCGDPVLAAAAGLVAGAREAGARVTLGGGTQMLVVAALVRHAGVRGDLTLATTSYLAADADEDLPAAARALDVALRVTDPGFASAPLSQFAAGEAKEGAGMGGALAVADDAGRLGDVEAGVLELLDREGTQGGPDGP
jgi:uncharacterized protein (TIGR00303 family)